MAPLLLLASLLTASAQDRGIADLAWLAGCWEAVSGDRIIEEHWLAPRGDNIVGISRTVRAGRLVEFEVVAIREQGQQLAYEARPSGQAPAVFTASSWSRTAVVFENLEHDFPQRIGYERKGDDRLLAWIEGTRQGAARRVEFPYQRKACATR